MGGAGNPDGAIGAGKNVQRIGSRGNNRMIAPVKDMDRCKDVRHQKIDNPPWLQLEKCVKPIAAGPHTAVAMTRGPASHRLYSVCSIDGTLPGWLVQSHIVIGHDWFLSCNAEPGGGPGKAKPDR